jgi:hypothetical protein
MPLPRPLRAALTALAFAAATLGAGARADPPAPLTAASSVPVTSPTFTSARATAGLLGSEDSGLGTAVPDLGEVVGRELVGKPIGQRRLGALG